MKLGNKIAKIVSADEEQFKVRLQYTTGSVYEVDLSDMFGKPSGLVSELLKGRAFKKCFVKNGALAWPNGFELCPDALKMRGTLKRN